MQFAMYLYSLILRLRTWIMNEIRKRKKYSQRQEKKAAKDLGAKVEANSGATKFGGADARLVDKLRIECKFTDQASYSLHLEDLDKLRKQAIMGGLEDPVFQLEFKKHKLSLAIVPFEEQWNVAPFSGTARKSLTIRVSEVKSLLALQEKPGDAIQRIGFWENGTISLDVKPRQFLVFLWDDYVNKRAMNDSTNGR